MSAQQSHILRTHLLRTHLPRAGFLWPNRASLLAQDRQDRAASIPIVLGVLRDHGGVISLQAGRRGNARGDIEYVFVVMFDLARADALAGRVDQFDTPLDWVADLRGRLAWGDFLNEDTFIDLFLRLGRGRQDWHANPREPFNTKEHGPLAHAIDAFHLAAGDNWIDAYDELFRGVLPPVIEPARELSLRPRRVAGDRDPAPAVPQSQGTAASSATGEPHPQTHIVLGGVQEEEEEEEEEEERERLARTDLGDDEDVEML